MHAVSVEGQGRGLSLRIRDRCPKEKDLTRRQALLSLFGAAFGARGAQPPEASRRFRADATIRILGIPVYSRAGVGGAFAFHIVRPGESPTHILGFCAGSFPERASGLNRLGFIQETVAQTGTAIAQAGYLGFMTASAEESMDDARKALRSQAAGAVPFVAILGATRPREARASVARFRAEARGGWKDWRNVLAAAQDALRQHSEARVLPMAGAADEAPSTFLFALTEAMAGTAAKLEKPYVYGAHSYLLRTGRAADPQMGKRLAAKRLTPDPARILRLNGNIRNQQTGNETKFKLWFEQGERVPLRIEQQVRSFLVLAFEADLSLTAPVEAPVAL